MNDLPACRNCEHRNASGVCRVLTTMVEVEVKFYEPCDEEGHQGYSIIKSVSPADDFSCKQFTPKIKQP
jgi:hypothetical protein